MPTIFLHANGIKLLAARSSEGVSNRTLCGIASTTTFVAVLFLNIDCLPLVASVRTQVPWSAITTYAALDTV